MNNIIPVKCIIDRSWLRDIELIAEYDGETLNGELIDISTQTEDSTGNIIPVGIVVMVDNEEAILTELNESFHSVPMEFIKKDYV